MQIIGQNPPNIIQDMRKSINNSAFWLYSAWLEIVLRYRATFLGPAWMIVSIAIFVIVLGNIYKSILNIEASLYFLHLASGIIFWTFMQQTIQYSSRIFQTNRAFFLNGNTLPTDFIFKLVTTNFIVLLHNFVVIIAVYIFSWKMVPLTALLMLAGVGLMILNAVWVGTVFAILGARYRDVDEIIQPILRIAFLATPVLWLPNMRGKGPMMELVLTLNPFYHFLEITRAPLMGEIPSLSSWLTVLGITVVGWCLAYFVYRRYMAAVPLWV
jgi:homopolymeric O-antigen transport system permease protein